MSSNEYTRPTPTTDAQPGSRSLWRIGNHRPDIGQLVMGLAFLAFVGCWVLVQTGVVTGDDVQWLLPIPWVVAGAIGLATSAFLSLRKRSRTESR